MIHALPDGKATVPRRFAPTFQQEHQHGLAIFATHGLADATTTLLATTTITSGAGEGNPIMAELLHTDAALATAVMLGVVAAVSILYPTLARIGEFPSWVGPTLATVGLLVAINNIAVVGVTHV